MENSPPHTKRAPLKRLNLRNWEKNRPEFWRRPFFYFGDHLILGGKNVGILDFGRKITLNFGEDLFFFFFFLEITWFWAEKTLEFRISAEKSLWSLAKTFVFFFFVDHLILGGKNLWISDLSETFRLKFRTNRLKLIQGQWKFESRSFAHFSLFQNSPPLFQIQATRLVVPYFNDDENVLPHAVDTAGLENFREVNIPTIPDRKCIDVLIGQADNHLLTALDERESVHPGKPSYVLTRLGPIASGRRVPVESNSKPYTSLKVNTCNCKESNYELKSQIKSLKETLREYELEDEVTQLSRNAKRLENLWNVTLK